MAPRKTTKKPTKEDMKAAIKKGAAKVKYADSPPVGEDGEELEEMPGGIVLPRPKSKRGRPVYKYNPQYAHIAKTAISKGATVAEIADMFGVANKTIYQWQQTYPDFADAFKELGNIFDQRIERTLAERALGYTYDAVKIFNNKGQAVIVPYQEHVPPDIGAIKMWLSARQPDRWRVKDDEGTTDAAEAFIQMWKHLGGKKDKS